MDTGILLPILSYSSNIFIFPFLSFFFFSFIEKETWLNIRESKLIFSEGRSDHVGERRGIERREWILK